MTSQTYLFGDSDAEAARLRAQGQLLAGTTRRFLERAGVSPGMRVLDVGCGAGDVSFCLAELVGGSGRVVGIDASPTILGAARRRAEEAGRRNVTFVSGDVASDALGGPFDAIVGRCVLFFVKDRAAVLRRLAGALRPGGVLAFQEPANDTLPPTALPPSPLLQQMWGWIREVYRRSDADLFAGLRLYGLFKEAGLPDPEMHLDALAGGGAAWGGYEYLAALVRILLPRIVELGVATEAEVGIGTLAARLRDEVAQQRGAVVTWGFVSAWARI